MSANNGDNDCAKLFGGIKKAEEALKATKFSVGDMPNPLTVAETTGKNVRLNANGPFFYADAPITFPAGINIFTKQVGAITLDNVQFAALSILHELGHRVDILLPDRVDPDGTRTTWNNGVVKAACFSDIKTGVRAQ